MSKVFGTIEFEETKKGGVLTLEAKNRVEKFVEFLGEHDISKKDFEKVEKAIETYVNEAAEDAVERAIEAMKKDSEIEKVDVKYGFGIRKRDELEIKVGRPKLTEGKKPGTNEKISFYKTELKGVLKTTYTKISSSKADELKDKIKKALAEG